MTNDTINPSKIKRQEGNICHPHNGIQITKNVKKSVRTR